MPTTNRTQEKLPGRFEDLVGLMPPQALMDEVHYGNVLAMIDRVMSAGKLTKGQQLYLETLVQLVEAYESQHHRVETSDLRGVDVLRQLMDENAMCASDLARLLGVHVSMGSKILKGERSLTVEHLRTLADRFKVRPELFMA
jgi:HTH-type transcriptional regulator/antitoxin HigA